MRVVKTQKINTKLDDPMFLQSNINLSQSATNLSTNSNHISHQNGIDEVICTH